MIANDILRWVERELAENRNDTIHDFLAFLAECAPTGQTYYLKSRGHEIEIHRKS